MRRGGCEDKQRKVRQRKVRVGERDQRAHDLLVGRGDLLFLIAPSEHFDVGGGIECHQVAADAEVEHHPQHGDDLVGDRNGHTEAAQVVAKLLMVPLVSWRKVLAVMPLSKKRKANRLGPKTGALGSFRL